MALKLIRALLCAYLVNSVLVAHSSTDPNDLTPYTKSILVPFVYPFSSSRTPLVNGIIHGKKFQFPVDTGSTGLLLGAPQLPYISDDEGEPGYEFLDSSSLLYIGRFVDISIKFKGQNGKHAASRVPALIVDNSYYCPSYNTTVDTDTCPDEDAEENDVDDICYMGVGFGRNTDSGFPFGTPAHNPFLNIKSVNGKRVSDANYRSGYTIGTDGINLGLTAANTQDYAFVDLDRGVTDDPRDWTMVNMSFKVDGEGDYSGRALIDTGLDKMFIQAYPIGTIPNVTVKNSHPPPKHVKAVKPGTKLTIGFPSLGDDNIAGYAFHVGDKTFPSQPSLVQPVRGPGAQPFVNTGRKLLWGFSVAFDAVGGRSGFLCHQCKGDKKSAEAGP